MKKVIGLFVAILACSAAQSESYFAASVTKFDADNTSVSADLTGITASYGTVLSDNMSGELRFGLGVSSDTYLYHMGYSYYDVGKAELDHYYGAYLKFSSASGQISPYAIFGLTKLKASSKGYTYYDDFSGPSEIQPYSNSSSEDDFSYGLGIDFANGFNIEYMQYLDKGALEVNGLSLGMKF